MSDRITDEMNDRNIVTSNATFIFIREYNIKIKVALEVTIFLS